MAPKNRASANFASTSAHVPFIKFPVIIVAKQPCFLNRTCAESVSLASMACDACTAQDDVRDAGVEAEESDEALLDLVARGGGRCGRCGRCGWGSSPEGQRPDTRLGAAPGRGEGEAAEDACRAHLPCTTREFWQRYGLRLVRLT